MRPIETASRATGRPSYYSVWILAFFPPPEPIKFKMHDLVFIDNESSAFVFQELD